MSGPPPAAAADAPIEVRIVGVPVPLLDRARQHQEALEREFRLITLSRPADRSHVTARLLELVDELSEQFDTVSREQNARIDEAIARDDATIDLEMRIPPSARESSVQLGVLLDEADEFCGRGDLLTLATPADCVTLRRWYLGQIVDQLDGAPPAPWAERAV